MPHQSHTIYTESFSFIITIIIIIIIIIIGVVSVVAVPHRMLVYKLVLLLICQYINKNGIIIIITIIIIKEV